MLMRRASPCAHAIIRVSPARYAAFFRRSRWRCWRASLVVIAPREEAMRLRLYAMMCLLTFMARCDSLTHALLESSCFLGIGSPHKP